MTAHMTQVEGFNVRVVFAGDSYGRDHWAVHREPEPLVEFYDARQDPTQFGPRGQFVSRYYAHTLLQREYPQGLCLDGDVPQWSVSTTGMRLVKAWLSTEIAWKSGEMPLPPYGIWTTDIDGKRVMGFTPEQMLQRDAQWQKRVTSLEADRSTLREALKRARFDSLNMSIADQQLITAALENTK